MFRKLSETFTATHLTIMFVAALIVPGAVYDLSVATASTDGNRPSHYAPGNEPRVGAIAPAAADGTLGVALLAAQVSDDILVDGSGATGVTKLSTGHYEVDFNRDVTNCFLQATSFYSNGSMSAEPRSGVANGVYVAVTNFSGASVDDVFYLSVYCAR